MVVELLRFSVCSQITFVELIPEDLRQSSEAISCGKPSVTTRRLHGLNYSANFYTALTSVHSKKYLLSVCCVHCSICQGNNSEHDRQQSLFAQNAHFSRAGQAINKINEWIKWYPGEKTPKQKDADAGRATSCNIRSEMSLCTFLRIRDIYLLVLSTEIRVENYIDKVLAFVLYFSGRQVINK